MKHKIPKFLFRTAMALLCLMFSAHLKAQYTGIETFGNTNFDSCVLSMQATDGGVITVYSSRPAGQRAGLIIKKVSATGADLWINQLREMDNLSANLYPVSIKEDILNTHNIFILVNADYASMDDVYFVGIDNSNGSYLGSRRLPLDMAYFQDLPQQNLYNLWGSDMIYLMNEPETRGDFLISANVDIQANRQTQIIYKIRPNFSLNWGRHFSFDLQTGFASFGGNATGNVKNVTAAMLEMPNGDVVLSGYINDPQNMIFNAPATTPPSAIHLMSLIDVSASGFTIITDQRYMYNNAIAGNNNFMNSAGYSITRDNERERIYTSFYGEYVTPVRTDNGFVADNTRIASVTEFDDPLNMLDIRFLRINDGSTSAGTAAWPEIKFNPADSSLIFVMTYTNNTLGVQNIVGSINPRTWNINWAKTFPRLNAMNTKFSWDITLLSNGDILVNGKYNNGTNRDVVIVQVTNDNNLQNCEELVTNLEIVDGRNFTTQALNRDRFMNTIPVNVVIQESAPEIAYGFSCKCPTYANGGYKVLSSSVPVTQNMLYDGKYYVPDGVIITFKGNAIIDFTNCDVIFGRCSGFNFEGKARLRANNSVFRTCSEADKWRGMLFSDTSTALVNECTYKNAIVAVQYEEKSTGEIANNLFQNCGIGTRISNVTSFPGSIDANTFEVSNPTGSYLRCDSSIVMADFRGIEITGSTVLPTISQNRFYNRAPSTPGTAPSFLYRGIILNNSMAYITGNYFSNMNQSIVCYGKTSTSQFMQITNNEIQVSKPNLSSSILNQILVQQSKYVKVLGNKLYSSAFTQSGSQPRIGIHIDRTDVSASLDRILVKDNEITGFDVGVRASKIKGISIIENSIINSRMYGIYSTECGTIDYSCNNINLDQNLRDVALDQNIGIYAYQTSAGTNKIYSNCVLESNTALRVEMLTLGATPLPVIRNNFFYNYRNGGIHCINYGASNIGQAPSTHGMNTMYSAYVGTAIDLIGTAGGPITAWNNYLVTIGGTAAVAGALDMQSAASCGHQVSPSANRSQIDPTLVCNAINDAGLYPTIGVGTELMIAPGFKGKVSDLGKDVSFENLMSDMSAVASIDPILAGVFYNDINSHAEELNLNATMLQVLKYTMEYQKNDWNGVSASLNTPEMVAYLGPDNHRLHVLRNNFNMGLQLSPVDLEFLNTMKKSNDKGNALMAIAIENLYGLVTFEPVTDEVRVPEQFSVDSRQVYNIRENTVNVYPNPFKDEVTVTLTNKNSDQTKVEVLNIMGQTLTDISIQYKNGTVSIDTRTLAPGPYLVRMTDGADFNKTVTIVKM